MSTPHFPNELSNLLGSAADEIDHGDSTAMLADVREVVVRRGRRRQVVAGVAAVGALVASGAVVATLTSGDGSDELVLSAPAGDAEAATDDTVVPDDTTSTGDGASPEEAPVGEQVEEQPAAPAPVLVDAEAPGVPANGGTFPVRGATVEYLGDQLSNDELGNGFPSQVLAWNGGFLSIATVSEPQPLPTELPPEIAEQFPPEVLELFPDGLPPSIDEAIAILEDAGLYDVVAEVVTQNPDVFDAIYSQPANVLSVVRFSIDGENWEEIDAAIPSGALQTGRLVAVGDRLVAAGLEGDSIVIRSSTDLVQWDEQFIAAPQRPADLQEVIRFDVSVNEIDANADRWILQVSTFGGFEPSIGLEGPLGEQLRFGAVDYGFLDEGVEITVRSGPDGEPLPEEEFETTIVPWSEWGLDGQPETESLFSETRYSATWDGPVRELPGSTQGNYGSGNLLALNDGFVEFGQTLRFSTDGNEWEDLDSPFGGYVNWGIETEAGFLVAVRDDFGRPGAFAYDQSDSTWTPADLSGIPLDSYTESAGVGVALLTAFDDPFMSMVAERVMSAEVDGYLYEQRSVEGGPEVAVAYTLTEIESGDVLSTETITSDDPFGTDFEFLENIDGVEGGSKPGVRLLDPATGELIIDIPFDSMTWENLDADGVPIDFNDVGREFSGPENGPTHWVVATAGDGIVVEQLDTAGEQRYAIGAAGNGEIVVVGFGDGTFARISLS